MVRSQTVSTVTQVGMSKLLAALALTTVVCAWLGATFRMQAAITRLIARNASPDRSQTLVRARVPSPAPHALLATTLLLRLSAAFPAPLEDTRPCMQASPRMTVLAVQPADMLMLLVAPRRMTVLAVSPGNTLASKVVTSRRIV